MKTNSNFIKVVFFALVILMSYTMTNAQKQAAVTPQDGFDSESRLLIAIEAWACPQGGNYAIVFHQIEGDVLDSRRYEVSWYNNTGKLVGNSSRTPDCLCGGMLTAVVYDRITNEYARARVPLAACNPTPNEGGNTQITTPEVH